MVPPTSPWQLDQSPFPVDGPFLLVDNHRIFTAPRKNHLQGSAPCSFEPSVYDPIRVRFRIGYSRNKMRSRTLHMAKWLASKSQPSSLHVCLMISERLSESCSTKIRYPIFIILHQMSYSNTRIDHTSITNNYNHLIIVFQISYNHNNSNVGYN